MDTSLTTDKGVVFTDEDKIFNIKWKVIELKSKRFLDKDILQFDYCDGWFEYANIFIDEINKKQNERNYNY